LKITAYAQKLIDGLDTVDFIDRVKTQQRNWIGRSTGAEATFKATTGDEIVVFTTRADTIFGVTYMVISPEHHFVQDWKDKLENWDEVAAYVAEAGKKSDFERTELAADKEKTGVMLRGVRAINPVNRKEVPIFISDYVLASYGTGCVMGVPAHDGRDWAFAKKFGLPIIETAAGGDVQKEVYTTSDTDLIVNSDQFNGLTVAQAKEAIVDWLEKKGIGRRQVNYKLRDWVFSRQRYWGEPIPMVWCEKCGWVPLPEDQLPLLLPEVESYEPTDNGESPIAKMTDWVNTTCPCCGGPAKRETDTMPQWAGSSWYFLRYMDPDNKDALASKEALEYWGQVDWYNGGMEHTTLHLLYSRFWNNFLHDIGVIPHAEPYAKRTSHGMILGKNPHYVGNVELEEEKQALIDKYGSQALRPSVKMSKSLGNVVNPDDVIRDYGADTMRLYIMFIGDFEKTATWSDESVRGCKKFLDRVWNLSEKLKEGDACSPENESAIHKAIKKVSDDIEAMKFNTAIAALMSLVNDFYAKGATRGDYRQLLVMLSPFAPHLCEELWEMNGFGGQVCLQKWPEYDESKTVSATNKMAVQVGGKVKANIVVDANASDEEVVAAALAEPKIAKLAQGMQLVKSIVVKGKLVSLIFKPQA
ncbi:MAG: leucine--tRNA ligase, partial [Lawsonibacter sp.]|nr:leucine--tRNA ligase [Lawsonibacter sp.]